jgi:glycosyltransferase involved in cell wall biosynthesis
MNWDALALVALILAGIPAGLFLVNLLFYRRISVWLAAPGVSSAVSVLIPARNEEGNIAATLKSVLANRGVEFEVVVLDDHSTDRTAEIVAEIAARDSRVRLELAPPLPPGWCGKPHACHVLAQRARHGTLVFVDADVQLAPDALQRMAGFMEKSGVALASGVPHQELGTFSERLLLPQIHFVLLGYLPLPMMRWTKRPAFSAGCGQLFIVRRDVYEVVGGHEPIRSTLHDGVKLPRLFRRHGFKTELFDATDVASCRMYRTNMEVWRGLGKNATEGLAAPGTILPMSLLLFGGTVLPFLLLAMLTQMSFSGAVMTTAAIALAWLARLIAVARFRQPLGSALLHPLGVLALLVIQWFALARQLTGKPAVWKGRSYGATPKTA